HRELFAVNVDFGDLERSEALAMALELLVLLLALVVEDQDFLAAAFAEDLSGDGGVFRAAKLALAVAHGEHVGNLELAGLRLWSRIDFNDVPGRDAELL